MHCNIRDHGAVGDGNANDTRAVQAAIDAVAKAGGGRVHCPSGVYRIGTIVLKDHVELHVGGGATLLGSADEADYCVAHNAPRDLGLPRERVSAAHLIFARDAKHVAITGHGVIDGNGRAFLRDTGAAMLDVPGWRPGPLITFHKCSDVVMRDVRIVDAPYWTVWPFGCDRVLVTGVTIKNNRRTPNGDGVNPDCCNGVRISDCHIDAGDDCIAVRSDIDRLENSRGACENITVANCTLITCCCAIRVGFTGDGPIRNCTFNNLLMPNTRTGINMLVPGDIDQWNLHNEHGPIIENIAFSNIQMQTQIAFYLWTGFNARPPGALRNVRIDNVTATAQRAGYIGGCATLPIEDLSIRGLDMTLHGEMDDQLADPPEDYHVFDYFDKPGIPHGIFARYVDGLTISDSRIRFGQCTGPWRNALHADRVRGLDLFNLTASGADETHAAIDLRDCGDASVRHCRATSGKLLAGA